MGSKISCSTCNPKPNQSSNSNQINGRKEGHVLRLWAEVFHVSASSGAVRWTQVSDDLVPISVTYVQNRYHVTAYNSRVDKVLDTWLSSTRLGQASTCFVYWKDSVTGDTWGLNFTSAQDARAFRECISASTRDFRRAESSYSLRESGKGNRTQVRSSEKQNLLQTHSNQRHSNSTPNSPSKGRQIAPNECTCNCMTSDVLHKQRNGRLRYATFTRQDSSGTTQSDGSVRRQHDRQQYFANQRVRSMEDREQIRRQQRQQMSSTLQTTAKQANASQLRSVKSTEDVSRLRQPLVSTTGTTTDDLTTTTTTTNATQISSLDLKKMLRDVTTSTTSEQQRPKSFSEIHDSMIDRSRSHRSIEGRRRSLERSQCVDFTDASPPTPARNKQRDNTLEEYENQLRSRLATQTSQQSRDDAIDVFETILKESMDDVQVLMREVQHELSLIRAEEKRFKSLSMQSLNRCSAPILDTLSIDGQLPFNYSMHSLPHFEHNLSINSMITSSEVSDDEKASLTTAISDEDDLDLRESPLRARSLSSAQSIECLGSVRKSGFLSVKKWLLRKKHSLELARKRGWKGYWVCLKGTTLLFYSCESRDGIGIESEAKHLIFIDSCLCQPIPEHPKRDNVFCLSTAFGDAYLLDAPCLLERDSWIAAIHCACASQLARNSGKQAINHFLSDELIKIEKEIEIDLRAKHETELLLSCLSSDEKQKQSILLSTILGFEEKIEIKRIEMFRLKCYKNSINIRELSHSSEDDFTPNPKSLLSLTNRRTKSQLNRLGVFTVSSLHAFNCAKNPQNLLKQQQKSSEKIDERIDDKTIEIEVLMTTTGERRRLEVFQSFTINDLLINLFQNNSREYYCTQSSRVLQRNESLVQIISNSNSNCFEIWGKSLFNCEMSRETNETLFGFSVESELIQNDLCVYVSRVENQSIAAMNGLKRFDELIVINGALVQDLDMMFVESILQEELTLNLMVRTTRDLNLEQMTTTSTTTTDQQLMQTTDELIESLVCPPPPLNDNEKGNELINEQKLEELIVPKVQSFIEPKMSSNLNSFNSQLIHFSPKIDNQIIVNNNLNSNSDKMRKVVKELIDTENTYCQSLELLLSLYLEPLSQTSLLSSNDLKVLFGSIVSIIEKQKQFKSELELIANQSKEELNIEAIADCFLNHAQDFRNYSFFCASHSRAVKLMSENSEKMKELNEWLTNRMKGQQIHNSLESFLIKPIQRVLKYPLLLTQMKSFCLDKDSKEYQKLSEALKAMESCAEYINEMQRIHEEYSAIFEHLARNYSKQTNQHLVIDLSPQTLIHYGGVDWINSFEFLGKNSNRKGVEMHSMCFVFNQFVVFLCKERIRHKKRIQTTTTTQQTSSNRLTHSSDVEIIRHQILIPVIEVQVRACAQSENETDFKWDLIQLKTNAGKRSEKVYKLSNSLCEYRNAFLRTIRQIIREDVQKMSLLSKQQNLNQKTTENKSEMDHNLVSCGLCGKDVSIGEREKKSTDSPIWKRRQDSNSSSR